MLVLLPSVFPGIFTKVMKHSLAVLRRKGLSVSMFLWYFFLYLQGKFVLGCFHAMWESVQLSLKMI